MLRPGISTELLNQAGVRQVGAAEAVRLCKLAEAGLWLPYLTIEGHEMLDGGKIYGRLRLERPQEGKKYHQATGTLVHVYLPPGLGVTAPAGELHVVEGEFKALALMEAGFAAVGISGFFGFARKNGEQMVPELREVLERLRPTRIYFCGDADTALNFQFAMAANRFAKMVQPIPVVLPRIPVNGPGKGADDCRQALNGSFSKWWQERMADAVAVNPELDNSMLTMDLFEREQAGLAGMTGPARLTAEQQVVKFAAALEQQPLQQDRVKQFLEKEMGARRSGVNRAVQKVMKQRQQEARAKAVGQEPDGCKIELNEPAGVWTRKVWTRVGREVFLYNKQLCRFHEGRLQPQSAAELVAFVDDPKRCRFTVQQGNGSEVKAKFTEGDARIFMGSWLEALDLIRSVEVCSTQPLLAWTGKRPLLVNGYNPELRVLAGREKLDMPAADEAAARLRELLRDYDFVTPGDFGRVLALLLSPALTQGGFLGTGRAPLFLVEKNEAGAGGSLLLRLVSQIYGLPPRPITRLDNPQRVIEDLSRTLMSGAGMIYFDNARGNGLKNLPDLESLLTEPYFNCRAPYMHGEADVTRRVLAVSSNGAVFSRDLASRTVKITIRKQPPGYPFHDWPEGSIEDHAIAQRRHYLGAIFRLVLEWAEAGRPAGKNLTGFRFGAWEKACAWILEQHFPNVPLLNPGHLEDQVLLADPDHDLLRNLLRLVLEGGPQEAMTATSLAELGVEAGLLDGRDQEQQNRLRLGKALKRRFPTDGEHRFDAGRFTVVRHTRKSPMGNGHDVAYYEIRREAARESLDG